MKYLIVFITAIILSGCDSTPKCSDQWTIDMVKSIIFDRDESKFNYIDVVSTVETARDEDKKSRTCTFSVKPVNVKMDGWSALVYKQMRSIFEIDILYDELNENYVIRYDVHDMNEWTVLYKYILHEKVGPF